MLARQRIAFIGNRVDPLTWKFQNSSKRADPSNHPQSRRGWFNSPRFLAEVFAQCSTRRALIRGKTAKAVVHRNIFTNSTKNSPVAKSSENRGTIERANWAGWQRREMRQT